MNIISLNYLWFTQQWHVLKQMANKRNRKKVKRKEQTKWKQIFTSLFQAISGTGFPEAEHSKVTSVPFLTTMLPSSGLGLTLGGTEKEQRKEVEFGHFVSVDTKPTRVGTCLELFSLNPQTSRVFGPFNFMSFQACNKYNDWNLIFELETIWVRP